jgi:hypothetical protein
MMERYNVLQSVNEKKDACEGARDATRKIKVICII